MVEIKSEGPCVTYKKRMIVQVSNSHPSDVSEEAGSCNVEAHWRLKRKMDNKGGTLLKDSRN